MKKGTALLLFWCSVFFACAQSADTAVRNIGEVVITGLKEVRQNETSINIKAVGAATMRREGTFNIADGLAKIPGMSQLSTGPGISKPVIRGLYGNRVLVLLSGMRFDNQQWQDEHGMGLSQIGIDRVEVIKGPLAVLYGTDAVGGLVNIIEERRADEGKMVLEINNTFHSNTLGTLTDAGLKGNRGNIWWRARVGVESASDYADGRNIRVLNSRYDAYYAKGTFGFKKGRVTSENNYHFSMNRFGFILKDLDEFMDTAQSRYHRRLDGPFHRVILNVLSSQNKIELQHSLLKIDAGFQSNSRAENEGGGAISLNMLLTTVQYHLEWIKPLPQNLELIISQSSSYENNTNYGARKIIPDAHMFEANAGAFIKYHLQKVILEGGAGVNAKLVKTLLTRFVNEAANEIQPFTRIRAAANGLAGVTVNPNKYWNLKLCLATGLRAPNLAELSSNGVREGTTHFEIGDPGMKNEQNLNADLGINFSHPWVSFNLSGYFNRFFNFIYLNPTGETRLGVFNVYRWQQQNTIYTGGEGELEFTPQGKTTGLKLALRADMVYNRTDGGQYIPFTPAPKAGAELSYTRHISRVVEYLLVKAGSDYVFRQSRVAKEEIATPAYYLLSASVGAAFNLKNAQLIVSVKGSNLLNRVYYDHLSRLKEFGLYNIGRNITINLSVPITFNYLQTKNQKQTP